MACGKCVLHEYGGICPVTRCAKHMLNGPCGGSTGRPVRGESRPALRLAIHISEAQDIGELDRLKPVKAPKNWNVSIHGGSRVIIREDHRI